MVEVERERERERERDRDFHENFSIIEYQSC